MKDKTPTRYTWQEYTEKLGRKHLYTEECGGWQDGFFIDYDELEEHCEAEQIPLPKEVWGCVNTYPTISAKEIIFDLEEQLTIEDAVDLCTKAQEEITAWVAMFNKRLEEVHGEHTFKKDPNTIVVLQDMKDNGFYKNKPCEDPPEGREGNWNTFSCRPCWRAGRPRSWVGEQKDYKWVNKHDFCPRCGEKVDWGKQEGLMKLHEKLQKEAQAKEGRKEQED